MALGTDRVRFSKGRMIFADQADRAYAYGQWRVSQCRADGRALPGVTVVTVPLRDPGDGFTPGQQTLFRRAARRDDRWLPDLQPQAGAAGHSAVSADPVLP
jgi:hypothetical protein